MEPHSAHSTSCQDNSPLGNPLDAPVGVFDSGVGGISVLRAIRQELPDENLIYVADSGNAPYGDRPASFIEARSVAIAGFLVTQGVKAIVVACNTATVVAVATLRSQFTLPIVAMEPAIKPAVALSRSRVIGVLATHQTLASESVQRLCTLHGGGTRILLQPCPGLVEFVERGELDGETIRGLLRGYLAPLLKAGADTLVLGCTHYSFLQSTLRDVAGPGVALVDSAPAVARELARRLGQERRPRTTGKPAWERFFSTAAPQDAHSILPVLWGAPVRLGFLENSGAVRLGCRMDSI